MSNEESLVLPMTDLEDQQNIKQNAPLPTEIQNVKKIDTDTNEEFQDQRKNKEYGSETESGKPDTEYLLCISRTWEEDASIFEKCFGVKFVVPGQRRKWKRNPVSSIKSRRKRKKREEKDEKERNSKRKHTRLCAQIGESPVNADRLAKEVLTLSEQIESNKCGQYHMTFPPNVESGNHLKAHDGVIGPPPKLINLITMDDDKEITESSCRSPDSTDISQSKEDVQLSRNTSETQVHTIMSNTTISFKNSHQIDETMLISHQSRNLSRKCSRIHTQHNHESQNLIDLTTTDEEEQEDRNTAQDGTTTPLNGVSMLHSQHIQSNRPAPLHQTQAFTPPSPPTTATTTDIRCQSCGMGFENQQDFDIHSKSHRAGKSFHCHTCDRTFMNKLSYLYHAIQHTNDQPHRCPLCSMEFQSEKELRRHQRGHKTGKCYSCDTCGEAFVHKLEYLYHAMKHQGLGPFKCSLCAMEFPRNEELTKHSRTHRTRKSHKCDECGEMFCRKLDLLYHAVEHRETGQLGNNISL